METRGKPSSAFNCGCLQHSILSLRSKALYRWVGLRGAILAPAGRWLCNGRANADGEHSECQISDASWFPTRLLDLSTLEETGRVPLVVTDLLDHSSLHRSEYVTLRHCWGAWGAKELPVLTQSNIDARVDYGMDLSLFSLTFRDAIEVANWFNSE